MSEDTRRLIYEMLDRIDQSNDHIRHMAPAIQEHSSVFQEIAVTVSELSVVTQNETEKIHASATDLFHRF